MILMIKPMKHFEGRKSLEILNSLYSECPMGMAPSFDVVGNPNTSIGYEGTNNYVVLEPDAKPIKSQKDQTKEAVQEA